MEYIKLKDICTTTQGTQISKENQYENLNEGLIRYLYIADFKEDNDIKYVKDVYKEKIVSEDDLVMANTGSPGAVFKGKYGVLSNNLFKISFDRNVLIRDFLYYYLSSDEFQHNLQKRMKGGVQKHLGHKLIGEQPIPVIDLETQKKIVEVLDKAQELIDKRKEQIEVLDALVKSRFIEMFGDPVSNPKGWRETNLGDLFVGDVDYRGKTPPKSAEGIPLISAANVKMGKVDLSNADYISEEDYKNWLKRGIPNYNDILITTEAPMGRVALYPKGLYQLSRRVIAFEPDKERLNPYFALYTISSESWQKRLYKKVRGSTVPRILKPDILSQQIQTPPIELQNEFEKFVNQVDKLKSQMETSLKELEDNFNSLMQKAFKGELF